MENIYADDWDRGSDREGFRWKRMRLVQRLGGELLGGSVYLLPPGQKSFPYHNHHANEELLVVLEGEVVLRTPAGEVTMGRGDAEVFRRGRAGAHQVINRSDADARYIMFSTMIGPEIAEYPDSGNVGLFGHASDPGEKPELWGYLDGSAGRDYYHGED